MIAIALKMLEFIFQIVNQVQDPAKYFHGNFHTSWPGILMKILKAIQEKLIGEKQSEKVLFKEKCIAANISRIPTTNLSGGSENNRSGPQYGFIFI